MLQGNPLISIIVPIYNGEQYLQENIESVLQQDYSNWELILINDGSTDKSGDICKKYVSKDKRIRFFEKDNGGVSSARNEGLAHVNGEYVTFVDADDVIEKNYCSNLLSKMEPEVGMVVYGLGYLYPDGKVDIIRHRLQPGIYDYCAFSKFVVDDGTMSSFTLHSVCAALYRYEIIKNGGVCFDDKIRYNEDGLFNTEYFLNSHLAVSINYEKVIYKYRVNLASASNVVNLCGSDYANNMQLIERRLSELSALFLDADIMAQIERRRVTLLLEKLIYLASKNMITVKSVREMIKESNPLRNPFKMNYGKMAWGKRVVAMAIVCRMQVLLTTALCMRYGTKEKNSDR